MKIVFMGTPEFARRPLEYLYSDKKHQILAVVTGPDKKAGRGLKLVPTAVKSASQALGIPALTPISLNDDRFIDAIRKLDADIFVVVAFRILPERLFSIPKFGSINLHGSLLPKYRGAAPINWALIHGEDETGLTTFFLKKKVDTGNIIYQEKITIKSEETFDELSARMSEMAGPVIGKTLDLIESGNFELMAQDNSMATPAPKIKPSDAKIDWKKNSVDLVNFIRGLSSVPGAYTVFRDKRIKIYRAGVAEVSAAEKKQPGQIIKDKHKLLISTADGIVEILELQPEGKAKMSGDRFLRGYQPRDSEYETRAAIVEDDKLVELYVERPQWQRLVGNIYKGRIKTVLPGMQAAFIDIGQEKAAFLHGSDMGNVTAHQRYESELLTDFDQRSARNHRDIDSG